MLIHPNPSAPPGGPIPTAFSAIHWYLNPLTFGSAHRVYSLLGFSPLSTCLHSSQAVKSSWRKSWKIRSWCSLTSAGPRCYLASLWYSLLNAVTSATVSLQLSLRWKAAQTGRWAHTPNRLLSPEQLAGLRHLGSPPHTIFSFLLGKATKQFIT